MEAKEVNQTILWWSRIGKWQALMVVATLAGFFATLCITGDKAAAVITTAVIAIGFISIPALGIATNATILALGIATIAIITAIDIDVTATTITAIIAIIVLVATIKITCVGWKVVWSSYIGEFLIILLPMALVLRG